MHEWALAEGVVTTALQAVDREGLARVTRLAVRIGELQHISLATFDHALRTVLPETEPRLRAAAIELEIEPAAFGCRACDASFGLAEAVPGAGLERSAKEAIHFIPELATAFLTCPSCASPDFGVTRGRGVRIAALEAE